MLLKVQNNSLFQKLVINKMLYCKCNLQPKHSSSDGRTGHSILKIPGLNPHLDPMKLWFRKNTQCYARQGFKCQPGFGNKPLFCTYLHHFSSFCIKNVPKTLQQLGCAASKRWLKYITIVT